MNGSLRGRAVSTTDRERAGLQSALLAPGPACSVGATTLTQAWQTGKGLSLFLPILSLSLFAIQFEVGIEAQG